jgi:DNA-binding NtrC family response regulator
MSAASSPADFADDLARRFTVVSLRVPGLARTCPKG